MDSTAIQILRVGMFPEFPLYEQLYTSCGDNKLSDEQQQMVVNEIKSMSEYEHEIVYALIRAHQLHTQSVNNTLNILPYDSKHMKKGIRFDLNRFPHKLQCILAAFVDRYQKNKQLTHSSD